MSIKHCCEEMTKNATHTCEIHVFPFDCPDYLIHYVEKFKQYGIVVQSKSMSFVQISYCPWCGIKLPDAIS